MMQLSFTAPLWEYGGKATWYFVTLPPESAEAVRAYALSRPRAGWGSVPVEATIADASWRTSIFPDKALNSYLLPIKAAIRKRTQIGCGDTVTVTLSCL
jgi:hypothetical protein